MWVAGGRAAALGALVAVSIVALALTQRDGAVRIGPDGPHSRVVMIGVRGLPWNDLRDGIVDGGLPVLAELAQRGAVIGDVFSAGHASEAEVLASAITGQFPFRHGIDSRAELARFRDDAGRELRAPWDWIAAHGGRVAAFGFPFGREERSAEAWIVPAGRVRATSAASTGTMARDRAVVRAAVKALRVDPGRHVFLYLAGLHGCTTGRSVLDADSCLAALDSMIGELDAAAGARSTFLLFSERGNPDGSMTWRPRFPRLERAPPVGCFLAWGHAVTARNARPMVAPVDLGPTSIYLAGFPLPLDVDGGVLYPILDDGHTIRRRPTFRP